VNETAPAARDRAGLLAAYQRRAALPVMLATFAVIPALIFEGASQPGAALAGQVLNWLSWLVLAGHVAILFRLAGPGGALRLAWLDLALVVVTAPVVPFAMDAARLLRLVRVLRLGIVVSLAMRRARAILGHQQFYFVALVAVAAVVLGGLGIHSVEGGEGGHIRSVGDGIWWAIVTATTVGYGDISPATTEGRIIATALMLLGIGVIGAFTATVASFFVAQDEGSELKAIEARLDRLEAKLDRLIERAGEPPAR
jgi:voltage-gated potassium channel